MTKKRNEHEAHQAQQRDRAERERLTFRQLDLRRTLSQQIKRTRKEHAEQTAELYRDIAHYMQFGKEPPVVEERSREREASHNEHTNSEQPRSLNLDRVFGLERD